MATQKNFTINHFNLIAITLIAIVVIVSYLDSMTRPILFLDESAYLARGVAIVEEGKIPTLPTSPGVSLIHAFNYWFWRNDPLGMDIAGKFSAFIGKIILHIALYAAITKSLNQRWFSTSIIIFANLRARLQLIRSVFRGISVAHLASFNYHEFKQKPFLILTLSSIVATSSLMRNDGFILFIGLTPIVAFYLRNQLSAIQFLSKMVIYWFLPFIFITGSMVALSWLTTGEFSPLPIARTYTAFEQGHGIVRRFELERQLKNPWVEGKKIASERYGSLEDNQGNVFIAISKNPLSWQEHIAYNFRDFFLRWHEAHNGHISLVSLFLCWFGWISLFIHRKKFLAISIATLFLPFTFYFLITFWLPRYVIIFSPVILFLTIHALSSLATPYCGTFFQRILIMAPPIIVGTLFVWYTSLYSDYMDGSQTSISGGISLAEILSGIGVYVLFASAWLSTYRIDWKTIGMAFILGIWLVGIGNIFNLGFSDKTQALLEKRSSYQTHVRNYIIFSFNNLRNAKVCTKDPSLPWYARQKPIIRYELFEPTVYGNIVTLTQLLSKSGCQYLLRTEGSITVKGIIEPVFSDGSIALLRINADSNLDIAGGTIITDFSTQRTDQWVRFSANNIDGTFQIDNGVLLVTYNNDVTKRDIFAHVLRLEKPIDNVMFVKMRVKISSGTNLTVDIVKDGQLIAPRFLNYYPGSGEWEEIVIPVDGRLESITVGIGEPNAERTTPTYRLEIDWIKAIVKP